MKRPLLALPLAAALLGLLLLLWLKKPGATPSAPPPKLPAPTAHAHEHAEPAKPADGVTLPPALTPTGSLTVRVRGRGSPVPGAEVVLMREGQDARMRFQTGPDGTRLILQIPAGPYVAAVTHPRFLPGDLHLSVEAGGKSTADVDLKTGARIYGRVTDRAGGALPDTQVLLVDGETRFGVASNLVVRTDVQGRYELPPVAPGNYGVRFKHEQFRYQDRMGIQIRTGAEETQIDAALELGARVAGRVLDEGGAPLAGAQVLFGNEASGGLSKTDGEGRFTVYGLSDGYVNGSATLKGYGTVYRRGVPPNTLDLEFRLAKAGMLVGRLIVEPLPQHFTVALSKYDPELGRPIRFHQKSMSFPPQGAFHVEDLAAGTYWVDVESDGYEASEQPQVTVAAGQATPAVTIRLRKK
ncbi:MAG TPA: carboxypeptidase-like regulatory domain-containing protein [Planctomycetota bacterium]